MQSHADTPVAVIGGSALYHFWLDGEQMAYIREQSITRFWTWLLKSKYINTTSAAVIPEGRRSAVIGTAVYEVWGDSLVRQAAQEYAKRTYSDRAKTIRGR